MLPDENVTYACVFVLNNCSFLFEVLSIVHIAGPICSHLASQGVVIIVASILPQNIHIS